MADNPEEWRKLRSEFIEAAVKYEEYETFIERTAHSEEWYYNCGRYFPVGLIRWPYKPYRKCWILVPDSGANEEPFSTMMALCGKAWLWLPRVIADEVLDTVEMHLSEPPSPPADTALFWANSHYQYWGWLLWFHWLRQLREENPTEAEKPSQKMVLAPFHCSADLIAQWGLDGSDGTIPEWLADPVNDRIGAGSDVGRPGSVTTEPAGLAVKPAADDEETRPEDAEIVASAIEAERGRLSDVELPDSGQNGTHDDPPKPSWDRFKRVLSFNGEPIRGIRCIGIAKNVVLVLDTFQELGWPDRVDSPLSPDSQKHHATILSLNKGLSRIRFRSDGEGKGFIWETL